MAASLVCVAMLGAGACRPMVVRPGGESGAEVVERREARVRVPIPDWWVDEPVREGRAGERVAVCVMADGEDLFSARGSALQRAGVEFRRVTGGSPVDETVETDSVRLAGGGFRAFVRLSGGVGGIGVENRASGEKPE